MADVLLECVSILPVAETICVALGVASDHRDEGEAKQHEDEDDLATGEPEFRLTIGSNGEDIDRGVTSDNTTNNPS